MRERNVLTASGSHATVPSLTRRDVLAAGAGALGLGALAGRAGGADPKTDLVFGVFTDCHYADRKPGGSRHYRDSTAKLAEFVKTMNQAKPDFAIVLGDFVDKGATVQQELGYLKAISEVYAGFQGPRFQAIGNHDVATLSKAQFVAGAAMPAPFYSLDAGRCHCIVLDANFRKDFSPYKAGNFHWTDTWIPPAQQKWLAADLEKTKKPTLVFLHQCLDDEKGAHGVKNAPAVRKILEQSGKVLGVFQGHHHSGGYKKINGIPYHTMKAMVEGPKPPNNAYALVTVAQGKIRVKGYVNQTSHPKPAKVPAG